MFYSFFFKKFVVFARVIVGEMSLLGTQFEKHRSTWDLWVRIICSHPLTILKRLSKGRRVICILIVTVVHNLIQREFILTAGFNWNVLVLYIVGSTCFKLNVLFYRLIYNEVLLVCAHIIIIIIVWLRTKRTRVIPHTFTGHLS